MNESIAKNTTLESKTIWEKSRYSTFLKNANENELLRSQVPFYYAVEAFPRLLLKLASQITNEDARHLIVDNIWEEHGQGEKSKYHTCTFKKHLVSLGFDGELFKNPFVTTWIDDLFNIDSMGDFFHQLAAIEYMYAVISESIANKLDTLTLCCEQTHYSKHSELDWSHGEEILISMKHNGIDFDESKFRNAQLNFINLFSKLTIPTIKEVSQVRDEKPVSFYHTREASNVINQALSSFDSEDSLDVLAVCSGGENIIRYLSDDAVSNVTTFDMNQSQLDTCLHKLSQNRKSKDNTSGKFEYLFQEVRDYFVNYENEQMILQDYVKSNDALNYVIELVFDNKVLNILFSDEATKYSKESFSEHFKVVYKKMIQDILDENITNENSINVIFGTSIEHCPSILTIANEKPITYLNQSAQETLSQPGKYHIIDLSNIGDWMPYKDFQRLIIQAFDKLHHNGSLVVRRLLGDYSLNDLSIGDITSLYDETGFYSETVMIKK